MQRSRLLALDYGVKNVGLARSDELGLTAQPIPSIPNRGRRDLLRRLANTVRDHEISELVVGIPWNMDGSAGESVRRVELFLEMLRRELALPVSTMDERLSTVEALELWRGLSPRQQRKYRTVDSLAAALILRRFLEES